MFSNNFFHDKHPRSLFYFILFYLFYFILFYFFEEKKGNLNLFCFKKEKEKMKSTLTLQSILDDNNK